MASTNCPKSSAKSWWLPNALFALLAVYLAAGQILIARDLGRDGKFSFLTGVPSIQIADERLQLSLTHPVADLQLTFRQDFGSAPTPLYPVEPNFGVNWSERNPRTVHIYAMASSTPVESAEVEAKRNFQIVYVDFGTTFRLASNGSLVLDSVVVDKKRLDAVVFLNNYVDEARSNVRVHYPFELTNLSGTLARNIGPAILQLLLYVLVLLFVGQAILLLISMGRILDRDIGRAIFDRQVSEFVERTADVGAIPLGLFGTVLGIWMALERPSSTFSSFDEVLAILRSAVFTTVLGLAIKLAVIIRRRMLGNGTDPNG